MDEASNVLRALANPRRLAIVRQLKRKQQTVGELVAMLKVSFPATSSHLRILRAADLVERSQVGLIVDYRIVDHPTRFVRRILAII